MEVDGAARGPAAAGPQAVDFIVDVTTTDGQRFTTFKSTLAQCTYFSTLYSARWSAQAVGTTPVVVHVDRDARIFRLILDLVRYGTVDVLPDTVTRDEYAKLERDLDFFQAPAHLLQQLRVRRDMLLPRRQAELGEATLRVKSCWKCESTANVKYLWTCPDCHRLSSKMETCACGKDRKNGTEVLLCNSCEHHMRVICAENDIRISTPKAPAAAPAAAGVGATPTTTPTPIARAGAPFATGGGGSGSGAGVNGRPGTGGAGIGGSNLAQ